MKKFTVPQSVFDSKLAMKIAKEGHRQAVNLLEAEHKRGIFDEGDPNHPKYNNGINYATRLPVSLFGYGTQEFLMKQYK